MVGGDNYGQGSSREHAALAPRYLGLRAVLVKSFARIHLANLINFGILPLTFRDAEDYDSISQGDELVISDVRKTLEANGELKAKNLTIGKEIPVSYRLTERQKQILLAGGMLNYARMAGLA